MTRDQHTRAERNAFRQFVDAVVAFSEDSGPANLERYLAASRSLEESRRSRETRPRANRLGREQFAAPSEAV